MTHLRIVKRGSFYFIEKRERFLFWTYWLNICEWEDLSHYMPSRYETYQEASKQLDVLVDELRAKTDDFEVLKTVSV